MFLPVGAIAFIAAKYDSRFSEKELMRHMSESERKPSGSAARLTTDGAARNGAQTGTRNDLEVLDDDQVMEVVSDAYWKLFERLITLDGAGTSVPAIVPAA
jgi:hypothetical protein